MYNLLLLIIIIFYIHFFNNWFNDDVYRKCLVCLDVWFIKIRWCNYWNKPPILKMKGDKILGLLSYLYLDISFNEMLKKYINNKLNIMYTYVHYNIYIIYAQFINEMPWKLSLCIVNFYNNCLNAFFVKFCCYATVNNCNVIPLMFQNVVAMYDLSCNANRTFAKPVFMQRYLMFVHQQSTSHKHVI